MGGKEMNEEELLDLMKCQLGEGSKAELEAMLAQGYSLQDVMDHFMKHGKTQEQEQEELKSKLGNMMSDPNMKPEDVLNALRDKLSSEDQAKIDDLLRSGMTMEDIIKKFVDGGMEGIDQLNNEVHGESQFEKQMKELAGGKNLTPEEMLELMKSKLGEDSKAKLEEMLPKVIQLM